MTSRISFPTDSENVISTIKSIVITATIVLVFGQYTELEDNCKNDTDNVDILVAPLIAGVALAASLFIRLIFMFLSCCSPNGNPEKGTVTFTLSLANIGYTIGFVTLTMATVQSLMYGNLATDGDLKDVKVPPAAMQTCVQDTTSDADDKFLSVNYFAWGLTHLILLCATDVCLFVVRLMKRPLDGYKNISPESRYGQFGSGGRA